MEYCKLTDRVHRITVASRLLSLRWLNDIALRGSSVRLEIHCAFVSAASQVNLEIRDNKERRLLNQTVTLSGAISHVDIVVSDKAGNAIFAIANFIGNHSTIRSPMLRVLAAPPLVFDQCWNQRLLTRGQEIFFSAQTRGIDDGERVSIDIYCQNPSQSDFAICGFSSFVQRNRIAQAWRFKFPIDTQHLFFSQQQSDTMTIAETRLYACTRYYQFNFQQTRENYLQFNADYLSLRLSSRSVTQCQAELFSSDGRSQAVWLQQAEEARYSVKPGPCLLVLRLTDKEWEFSPGFPTNAAYDRLNLPLHINLPTVTEFIAHPLPHTHWQSALHFRARALSDELIKPDQGKALRNQSNHSDCDNRVILKNDVLAVPHASQDPGKLPQAWNYYRLSKNLLLPITAVDAAGVCYYAPALAFVGNDGSIMPFYLAGNEKGYRYALFQHYRNRYDNDYELAIWTYSGQALTLDIPQTRIRQAIQRLRIRERDLRNESNQQTQLR